MCQCLRFMSARVKFFRRRCPALKSARPTRRPGCEDREKSSAVVKPRRWRVGRVSTFCMAKGCKRVSESFSEVSFSNNNKQKKKQERRHYKKERKKERKKEKCRKLTETDRQTDRDRQIERERQRELRTQKCIMYKD